MFFNLVASVLARRGEEVKHTVCSGESAVSMERAKRQISEAASHLYPPADGWQLDFVTMRVHAPAREQISQHQLTREVLCQMNKAVEEGV